MLKIKKSTSELTFLANAKKLILRYLGYICKFPG
jgi:hypothetical protein